MADRPRMLFNAFHMFAVSHHAQGLWAEPDSRQLAYNDPQMWIDLARLLERGRFDTLFFADVLAPYETYRGSRDAAVFEGMQFPTGDPSVLIPLLAYHTEHLGFTFTQNILQEHPYPFARKMSTLDHLTGGRVAWNIVTSFLPGAGRNLGFGGLPDHAERYARAEDFTAAVYKLWECSWEDDAVLRDRDRRQFADPAKVHAVRHRGEFYSLDGPHLSEPSPQRTPLLFQAGMSTTGRAFAGKHAEALFIGSTSPAEAAPVVADVRRAAVRAGRGPDHVKIFVPQSFLLGSTEEEARRRDAELLERQTVEGNLARMSVFLDRDFGLDGPETPVSELRRRDVPEVIRKLLDHGQHEEWTLGQLIRRYGNRRFVGTPEQVADRVEQWQEAGVDGINLEYVVSPTSFAEFVEHVAPLLRERGLMQREYREGTLREKFFPGGGSRLPPDHPARAAAVPSQP
ncbi:LLM class flavin-dependent oxidoreductase [Kutzneria buriramensis]|uniref:FMN-dependent oxidoreductase (Nitrilotriacetate monooxygenase family) n=1 Tax=Kutzneria buriramensis TaxID=1045776 RepID=A0A3E0HER9_9PSEU|nr:LLM class flavin-dependent oxidoreductase [Kutzneria buriramensis]REH42901.1 FMN-dependent oxidoreductase (nitrilotriacetate monooxygenase family) [Kutzneria buriramensis]